MWSTWQQKVLQCNTFYFDDIVHFYAGTQAMPYTSCQQFHTIPLIVGNSAVQSKAALSQ